MVWTLNDAIVLNLFNAAATLAYAECHTRTLNTNRELGGSFTPLQVIMGFVAQDLFFGRRARTDVAAHMGGLAAGAAFGYFYYG